MALADRVTARLSALFLRSLTNPDLAQADAVDTARLDLAIDDVEADFVTFAQEAYDDDLIQHNVAGVQGVVAYLMSWGSTAGGTARTRITAFQEALGKMALTRSRARIQPTTTSTLTPRAIPAEPPAFDEKRFDDIKPEPPPAPATPGED